MGGKRRLRRHVAGPGTSAMGAATVQRSVSEAPGSGHPPHEGDTPSSGTWVSDGFLMTGIRRVLDRETERMGSIRPSDASSGPPDHSDGVLAIDGDGKVLF